MKKSRLLAAVLSGILMLSGSAALNVPVYADGTKVVTLGADLSEDQKQTMLRYFKVNRNEVQILTVTNQDERNHLAAYIPLAEIGSRTFSCAYVNPTSSGGIKVRTANLSYVTGNMIASSLTTAGVRNCEVIAAAPFKVSGTGALTGIQMAYETASGEVLAPEKKELAVQEIKVTEDLASVVGNNDATNIVNKTKMEVIQNNVTDVTEIYNIVNNIAIENNVNISETEINTVVELMEGIAEQDYAYEDFKDTLEHVDENLNDFYDQEVESAEAIEAETVFDEDSILKEINEADLGLGDDVAVSSTENQALEAETYDAEVENGSQGETKTDIAEEEWPEDPGWTDGSEEGTDENEGWVEEDGNAEDPGWTDETEPVGTDMDGGSELSEQAQDQYDQLKRFCEGEYENDFGALAEVMGDDFYPSVQLNDAELGAKLSAAVEEKYYEILRDGTGDYTPDESAKYMSDELNVMDKYLKKLFGIDGMSLDGEDILEDLSQEEKEGLYADTILFFEKMYGEESFDDMGEEEPPYEEAAPEESYEEPSYTEEGYSDDGGYQEEPSYEEDPGYSEGDYGYETEEGYTEEYYG